MNRISRSFLLVLIVGVCFVWFAPGVLPVSAQEPAPPIADVSNNYCAPDFPCDPSIPPARRFALAGAAAAMMDESIRPIESYTPEIADNAYDIIYSSAAVPFAWVDATTGTNTGMTGRSYGQITAPIPLPFPFKFYENTYDSVKIAASGFLTFADSDSASWQGQLPDPYAPNNLLAPYWSPFLLRGKGKVGKVFFATGGTAPNRYFVVQWNRVKGGLATDTVGGNDEFTFEVILYEDHSILFQYSNMTYTDRYYCGVAGIEDAYGLLGVNNVKYCKRASSPGAVKFTRPAPAARYSLSPSRPGELTPPGVPVKFTLTFRNTGDLGDDTFNFLPYYSYNPTFFEADGVTLLADTDGDTYPDTGLLAEGASRTLVVQNTVPADLGLQQAYLLPFTLKSTKGVDRYLQLPSAHMPDFSVAFRNNDDGAMTLDLVRNSTQHLVKVTPDGYNGSFVGLLKQPNGNYLYAWNKDRCVNASCRVVAREIEYTLLDANGASLHPIQKMEDLGTPEKSTYAYSYGMAATSNNVTGIAYIKEADAPDGTWQQNVWFARVDAAGNPLGAPRNLTKNKLWGNGTTAQVPFFYNARVAATLDNRFVVVWQREILRFGKWTNDIYFQILNGAGNPVSNITNFTQAPNGRGFYSPAVLTLNNGQVLLAFTGINTHGLHDAYAGLIANDGTVLKKAKNLSDDGFFRYDWYYMDAALLDDGNIALAWNYFGGTKPGGRVSTRKLNITPDLQYAGESAILDTATWGGAGPVSITGDSSGHGILTWHENHPALRYNLYLSVPGYPDSPLSFQRSNAYISTGFGGMGNAK